MDFKNFFEAALYVIVGIAVLGGVALGAGAAAVVAILLHVGG